MYILKTLCAAAIPTTMASVTWSVAENATVLQARGPQWRGGPGNTYISFTAYSGDQRIPSTAGQAPSGTTRGETSLSVASLYSMSSAGSPSTIGTGGDWFGIANKWRVAGGKPAFVQDATLVGNAQKTADDSVGGLHHELNPGTFAQVLAPGDRNNFESVYVGGWLCELPASPGLNDICSTAAQGWNHEGQTGHAEILTGDYQKIGCALGDSTGVWACDLS
ncbi:uncharacterized protein A1O9_12968 [Exophiala aquamarina CBS 119918]|uniref:SCP domain-containing protein n=1 Tax=Exophiala aquamarina CBS 119918 TaxID=1182545 RepID=A0A072NTL3_9EURO|nr:uncharacterized protein A1O9_12968 [Exophiala aquamarina CBS 119918]KEF50991.1 hypothetical protein A1O9_12968 [Exophiala aquamarina CBS 119918]